MPDTTRSPLHHDARPLGPAYPLSATLTLGRQAHAIRAGGALDADGRAARAPIVVCVGTRPEIIKMAPVCRALNEAGLPLRLLHTGQHQELAEPLYEALGLPPDRSLPLTRDGDSLAGLAAALLTSIDPVLAEWKPAALLVHGDTSSAAMAALAGFWRAVPVAHVEAGLRSHQARDPFPEELNRSLIARVASWHFAPTAAAVANLRAEGIAPRAIHQVGNTIVDATVQAFEQIEAQSSRHAASNGAGSGAAPNGTGFGVGAAPEQTGARLIVVIAHRRENWGAPIRGFVRALGAVLAAHPELAAVWTLHANPTLAAEVRATHAELPGEVRKRLHLLPPLEYFDMIALLRSAWVLLTDSGGLQEEACALGLPVLVLRHTTERPELIEAGAGRLIGTDPLRLAAEIERLWREPELHQAMRSSRNPFGDGHAGRRIASVLSQWYPGDRRGDPRVQAQPGGLWQRGPVQGAL